MLSSHRSLDLPNYIRLWNCQVYVYIYINININSTNIPPIMIINRIYETENLLSL